MDIAGLPLHPLVVHAVVVFAPLAALTGLLFAWKSEWRWLLRWPLVAATVIAVVTAYVATITGRNLEESRGLGQLAAVRTHEQRGQLLRNALFLYTVLVAVAAWRLGGVSALVSGRGSRDEQGGVLDLGARALLALGALAVLVTVVLAGDSGARAVWGS